MHFKNFYAELKSINKQQSITEDCWWGEQTPKEELADEKPSLSSLIRIGDRPSVIIIEPDVEVGNEGGSIEDTPKNPVISATNDPTPNDINAQPVQPQVTDADMVELRERWARASGIKETR